VDEDRAMSQTKQKKMTVEEFFDWQQRQDRNYELVDGVPVLCLNEVIGGASGDPLMILRNILSDVPEEQEWSVDERLTSAMFSKADMMVSVVPSSGACFDFARAIAKRIMLEQGTLLLFDTEEPRATLWFGQGANRRMSEVVGIEGQIDLREIGVRLRLNRAYRGMGFDQQV
jgi:hypothetical protein